MSADQKKKLLWGNKKAAATEEVFIRTYHGLLFLLLCLLVFDFMGLVFLFQSLKPVVS